MSGISLTASMRSNLLSLQNIASQQDIVQNRLATGLKVSSAIDNPSSYYTASSLNNRAADLTALLDAMLQGIQTIKAASEAIESGTKFLEQAKAVANQALETTIPTKEWFEEQVGKNGVVVENAQELLDAVKSNKETIVVYGKIELTDQTVTLKQGQKLVGTEYYIKNSGRNADGERFSQINIKNHNISDGIVVKSNSLVSDLTVGYSQGNKSTNGAINVGGANVVICNLDVNFQGTNITDVGQSAIAVRSAGNDLTLSGRININAGAGGINALGAYSGAKLFIEQDAVVDITILNFVLESRGIRLWRNGTAEIHGKVVIRNASVGISMAWGQDSDYGDNHLFVSSKAEISFQNCLSLIVSGASNGAQINKLVVEKGCKLSADNNYFVSNGFKDFNDSATNHNITIDYILLHPDFSVGDRFFFPHNIMTVAFDNSLLYNNILSQYNTLIADSTYKGINLLDGQNLKINFNEDRSSKIDVAGVEAGSDSLGLRTKEWKTAEDIEKSISELEEAINSLRSFASAFGNYYSIVTTRQDFTENLINVLEEGADKLTLADMNQESANMLALQTSQQLAVNSLSLASQASQSILKLF